MLSRFVVATAAVCLIAGAAAAQTAFTKIGTIGEYRLDGLRDGTHKGQPVRFLDVAIRNTGKFETFPASILVPWWQGRNKGEQMRPLQRDGSDFGMYNQTVKPGAEILVTYAIPVRDDVSGITIEFQGDAAVKKLAWTFPQLAAGAPGTVPPKP